ncbi:hypothetical protein [Candidatus Magnetaquicoccus inordinatus]|uniref:hypothetical protein n=1 Tax=Candidatus Magnetaquicoccus inordinatus TaxID=2496818 RepID=UPI00102C9258|nr:hypothetical protein [Candidatus Magnetaquicoccus inordinatus]
MERNKFLRSSQAVLDSVDDQLRKSNPPEVQETYQRLCAQGYSDQDARQLIGAAVANESFMILVHHDVFDLARYVATLRNLPRLPLSHA